MRRNTNSQTVYFKHFRVKTSMYLFVYLAKCFFTTSFANKVLSNREMEGAKCK